MLYLLRKQSLRRQLVFGVSALLGLVLLTLALAIGALVAIAAPDARGADNALAPRIAASLEAGPNGLRIEPSEALHAITASHPQFWFIAADAEGRTVAYGVVPEQYAALAGDLSRIRHLEIQTSGDARLTAAFATVQVDGRPVKLIIGGKFGDAPFMAAVAIIVGLIYLPVLIVWAVLSAFAVPWLVGRSLSGLNDVMTLAAAISVDNLPTALHAKSIPEEIQPLVAAVNSALRRVEDSIRSRQRFLADAAHELRTPISVLQARLETLPPSAEREALLRDTGRLAAIANQLLDMQRFAFIHHAEPVDLREIAERVTADLAPPAIAAGYELNFVAPDAPIALRGDPTSIDRALTNLVTNAIQHGGGHGAITVFAFADGSVEVQDEGPGIPIEAQALIFEPFYRARSRGEGAGLGLALVRQIARLHGGEVSTLNSSTGARLRVGFASPSSSRGQDRGFD